MIIMKSSTTYEKKHKLTNNTIANHGFFIESSIWSLNEDDRDSIAAIGLLEVDIINGRTYSTNIEIEAKGSGIRWETQPLTNKRMFITPLNSDSKNNKFSWLCRKPK